MAALPFPVPTALLSSPSFVLSRPTEADAPAMAELYHEAFQVDPMNTCWWSPDQEAQLAWQRRRILRRMRGTPALFFKITDVGSGGAGEQQLVAWARWDIPKGSTAAFGMVESATDISAQLANSNTGDDAKQTEEVAGVVAAKPEDVIAPVLDYPEGGNGALLQSLLDIIANTAKKWNASSMLGLSAICTSPKYFRRGAARALLTPMLDIADAEGLRTYLEATPAGKPLYEKLGFQVVETIQLDLAQLTKDHKGVFDLAIMIREPKTAKP